jgi:hypothetical protein
MPRDEQKYFKKIKFQKNVLRFCDKKKKIQDSGNNLHAMCD